MYVSLAMSDSLFFFWRSFCSLNESYCFGKNVQVCALVSVFVCLNVDFIACEFECANILVLKYPKEVATYGIVYTIFVCMLCMYVCVNIYIHTYIYINLSHMCM